MKKFIFITVALIFTALIPLSLAVELLIIPHPMLENSYFFVCKSAESKAIDWDFGDDVKNFDKGIIAYHQYTQTGQFIVSCIAKSQPGSETLKYLIGKDTELIIVGKKE